MQEVLNKILGRLIGLMAGLVWGFFVAFNMVFSDVFGSDMLWAILYVAVAYLILGLAFGLVAPSRSWRWSFWLCGPGFAMVALVASDAPERWLYMAAVLVALSAGALAGSFAGSKMAGAWASRRGRRRAA